MKTIHAPLTTGQIRAVSSLSRKQVEQWLQAGVVVPSLTGTTSPGKGQRHRWTNADAVLLALVADVYRATRMPVQHLRAVAQWLRSQLRNKPTGESRIVLRTTARGVSVQSARAGDDAITLVLPLTALLDAIQHRLSDVIEAALPPTTGCQSRCR